MRKILFFTNRDLTEDGLLTNIFHKIINHKPEIVFYSNLTEFELSFKDNEFIELENILKNTGTLMYFLFGSADVSIYQKKYPQNNMFYFTWEMFFLLHTYKVINYNKPNINLNNFNIIENFDKLYINYNHNPHIFRCMLIDKLNQYDLFNIGFNSWNKLTKDYYNGLSYDFKNWDEKYCKIDDYYKNGYRVEISDKVLEPNSLFNLVSESSDEFLIFSEKTWKPILIQQPFLAYGAQYQNLKLKEFGFELYDEIFDYSFDESPFLETRLNGIIKNIENLKNSDYQESFNKIKNKLIKNKENALYILNENIQIPNELVMLYKEFKNDFILNKESLNLPEYVYEILEKQII